MRWARFDDAGAPRYGLVEGDTLRVVEGNPFAGHSLTDRALPLAEVTLMVPVIPPTFYCVGLNYAAHVREVAERAGQVPNLPTQPDVGYRAQSALIPHDAPIIIPRDATEKVQYEGELVVVIGRQARHLTEETALDCVLGYTIGNDVSERSWQKSDRTLWRAKNADTFKPMGPWIDTEVRLEDMETIVRVNGNVTTRFRTADMIFGVRDFLVAITRYITLQTGDVIWMGTDGHAPNLRPGDRVEVEITGIGTLSNPVMAEE
ncbi:MAG: fumarylacetoacetate hydrolase family protein [Pseudooceanicola atlanticus]